MKDRYNIIGKKFGRLFVVYKYGKSDHGDMLWECVCDCGKIGGTTMYRWHFDNCKYKGDKVDEC